MSENKEGCGCGQIVAFAITLGLFFLVIPGFFIALLVDWIRPLASGPIKGVMIIGIIVSFFLCYLSTDEYDERLLSAAKRYLILSVIELILLVLHICFYGDYVLRFLDSLKE